VPQIDQPRELGELGEMTEAIKLPAGFEALEPFAAIWGNLKSQNERYLKRQHSSMESLTAFYKAAATRLDEIFEHLEKFPKDALPASEALLYRTTLGLTEVAVAVEVFHQPCVPYAPFPHTMAIEWNE
jgi:hypothetical protein